MRSFKSYISEGSHDFKDPWAVMSPEDRKEANRLFKAAMKAFPSSPKQKELHAKLMVLYKKYGIGQKASEATSTTDTSTLSEAGRKGWHRHLTHITELFERPYPVREYKRLGSGIGTLEITYHAQVDGQDLMIDITNIGKGWEINFTLDGSHELTHAGKPHRILATVVEAVKMFLKWYMETWDELPKQLDMVSKTSEGKRDAVYSAIMNRFGKEYGYKIVNRRVHGSGPKENKRTVTTARLAEAVVFPHLTEGSKEANWVRPKTAAIIQEYEIEHKKHLVHEVGNVFPTVKSFLDACKKGIVREITKNHDYYIANRSHTKSMKQLLSLIKTYRSYPQYRNEDTLNAMKEAMLSGKPMDMPIIVRERNTKDIGKHDRVFAGNTRMDMAFMHGLKVKALIIFLPKGVKL